MISLYIAMSLDGFIAPEDGSLDWLEPYNGVDADYESYYNDVGMVLLGRTTYDQIKDFTPFPYKDVDCFVFTHNKGKTSDEHAIFIHEDPKTFLAKHNAPTGKKIWLVGGAKLIKTFLEHDLIDEYVITIIPTLLGTGRRLFSAINMPKHLDVVSHRSFDKGLVQITYKKK